MLGFKLKPTDWQWAAHGKIPAARDFFTVGTESPVFKAFFGWLDTGCQQFNDRDPLEKNRSWRFWVKGPKKHQLLCGIIKNSSDKIGRPYPLMLIGSGSLKNWEKQWDTIPAACEGLWSELEYLTTKRYDGLEQLNADLRLLKPRDQAAGQQVPEMECRELSGNPAWIKRLKNEHQLAIPLTAELTDLETAIRCFHVYLKNNWQEIPGSVFLGGQPENPLFVVFNKGLTTDDFLKLWSD